MGKRYKPLRSSVCYHCMSRTAQQQLYFKDHDVLKTYWVEQLKFYAQVYYVKVDAFAILSNHFHLCLRVFRPKMDAEDVQRRFELLQSRNAYSRTWQNGMEAYYYDLFTDLSEFMKILNWRMSIFHNRLRESKGHLWEAPYKSKVVDSEQYRLTTMTYIDLNGVRAGLAKQPELFRYSSIAEIHRLLESRDIDLTPRVGILGRLPDGKRGKAYIALVNYLYERTSDGKGYCSSLRQFLGNLIDEEGLELMWVAVTQEIAQEWQHPRKAVGGQLERAGPANTS